MRNIAIVMRGTRNIIFSSVISFLALAVQAQQAELDPVTITATLQPVSASNTGRNITVIKGEQFSKLPVNSLDELLRFLPGIEVQARGPMGSQSDIVLRGGTFQQVLVIIDGIRINDPNTGHFNSYIPIAPGEIERIEILKGASSAIYGSEAVGGVIQVITKSFAAKREGKAQQLTAQATAGQYGLFNAQVGGFYQSGNTAVTGGVITNNATGQQQRGLTGFFHNTTASVSLSQYLNENWSVALRSAYDNRDFAAQNFYTTFRSDTATEKVSSLWNQFKLTYNKDRNTFTFDLGYKAVKDEFLFNASSVANVNKSNLLQGQLMYKWQATSNTTVTAGSQWVNKQIKSNDRGNHQLNQVGGFLLVNQKAGTNLNLNPAVRLQWSERSGWEFVPQMNFSYKITDWQFRGSAGKTIRDADFTERYNNYNKTLVTGGSIGNPDLKAERSFSYEAGADFFGIKNLKIAATVFRQEFSGLIDYATTAYKDMPRKENLSPTGTFALAKNIAKINSTGVETDIQYSKQFENKQELWLTYGFTCIDSKSDNATPSFYVSSHAKFISNFNIRYTIGLLSLSINGLFKQRNELTAPAINATISKEYFVMNIMVQAFIYKNKLSIYGQVDNVFNKQYSDLLGSQMPGRWPMGGVKLFL
jgi:iron complex outermembrane receptor protein